MEHKEYIRIVPNSPYTVLFIHGIAGTPNHFRFLQPLVPQDWSVYNLLLDGHGHGVSEFSRTSMEKWKAQVSQRVDQILTHSEKVIIVGHSMGTLLAIEQALRYPERIDRLFLLAVPLRPFVRPRNALLTLTMALGIEDPSDKAAQAMAEASGIQLTPKLWEYIPWMPNFASLLRLCRQTRRQLPRLTVPCRSYQSWQDELVSNASNRYLKDHPYIHNTVLKDSGHFAYSDADKQCLIADFEAMLQEIQ